MRTRLRITAAPASIGNPPSRTTRSPSARLPGVRPDHHVSNTMNQPKKTSEQDARPAARCPKRSRSCRRSARRASTGQREPKRDQPRDARSRTARSDRRDRQEPAAQPGQLVADRDRLPGPNVDALHDRIRPACRPTRCAELAVIERVPLGTPAAPPCAQGGELCRCGNGGSWRRGASGGTGSRRSSTAPRAGAFARSRPSEIDELALAYRAATSDLAIARTRGEDPVILDHLNRLTARAHSVVYVATARTGWSRFVGLRPARLPARGAPLVGADRVLHAADDRVGA